MSSHRPPEQEHPSHNSPGDNTLLIQESIGNDASSRSPEGRANTLPFKWRAGVGMADDTVQPIPFPTSPLKGEEACGSFPESWRALLAPDLQQTLIAIESRVTKREAAGARVFPQSSLRYRALAACRPDAVRVVIVGQDPYHGLVRLPDGSEVPEATGLSFSVPSGARLPPSLRNIYKELAADLDCPPPTDGDLGHWAAQGVLLLNTVLTVEEDSPKSHDRLGWQTLTAALLANLSRSRRGLVFMLWGKSAQALAEPLAADLAANAHTVIASSHPSPIGGACHRGFFGSRPFSRANQALLAQGLPAIDWRPGD